MCLAKGLMRMRRRTLKLVTLPPAVSRNDEYVRICLRQGYGLVRSVEIRTWLICICCIITCVSKESVITEAAELLCILSRLDESVNDCVCVSGTLPCMLCAGI